MHVRAKILGFSSFFAGAACRISIHPETLDEHRRFPIHLRFGNLAIERFRTKMNLFKDSIPQFFN